MLTVIFPWQLNGINFYKDKTNMYKNVNSVVETLDNSMARNSKLRFHL